MAGSLNVIIVGAGIAGLSSAIVLRPHASKITILEKASDATSMNIRGAGLAQYTSAANMLRNNFGLQPLGEMKMVQGKAIRAYGWDGKLARELTPPTNDWYMAHRGTLLDELYRKATEEDGKTTHADVVFSQEVAKVDVEAGTLTTVDGKTFSGDLIIGAEGVRSVVRSSIVDNVVVRPSGLSIYRWTLQPQDWAHLPPETVKQIDELIGPSAQYIVTADHVDQRFLVYRCHQDGTVNGAVILPDHKLQQTSEDWAASGSVAHMQKVCSELGSPLKEILGCVKECGQWQLRQQAPLPRWAKGKAIVLGDAAHPSEWSPYLKGDTLLYCID
ncbi:hypothetical protein CBS101457_005087 [Exobasidium rhododendri]|nr:hypothetical protein CBS101457_005087 [Exobasidium rhododendri]